MEQIRTLLKREESYAVHALIQVAEQPGISAAEIAERLQMPPAFMAKVLRKLGKAGFVDNKLGRGGGVTLLHPPRSITLLDILEGVSGTVLLDTCQTEPLCVTQRRRGHCNLKLTWIATSSAVRKLLAGVTLEHLVQPPVAESDVGTVTE